MEKWKKKIDAYLTLSPDGIFAENALYLKGEWRRMVEGDIEGAVAYYKQALEKKASNSIAAIWARIRLAEALVLVGEFEGAQAQYVLARKEQAPADSEERKLLCTSLVRSAQIIARQNEQNTDTRQTDSEPE